MLGPMPVSVVIPARNAAAHIGESVASALAQGAGVGEVIAIDDHSTDGTAAIVQRFDDPRVRLVAHDRAGVSAARNLGARLARGNWLMFLDADDRLRPGAVPTLLAAAEAAPDAMLVYGDYDLIDGNSRPIGRRALLRRRRKPSGAVLERLAAGNFIVNGGVMIIRADSFAAAGGFDDSLRYCEDWHCWCRLAAVGAFHFVPVQLLDYRLHATNTTAAAIRSPRDFLPAVERVFSDRLILGKLPAAARTRLRRAAEIHLLTYSAAQAIRFGRYRDAFAYLGMVGQRSLLSIPRSAMSLGLAFVGI
jgi:glycosyltransferase involved in cell wall biosynthesis